MSLIDLYLNQIAKSFRKYEGIGVLFKLHNLKNLGDTPGNIAKAKLFQLLEPEKMRNVLMCIGETYKSLKNGGTEYCIAFFGKNLKNEYIQDKIKRSSAQDSSQLKGEFIFQPQIGEEPLPPFGFIDSYAHLLVSDDAFIPEVNHCGKWTIKKINDSMEDYLLIFNDYLK
ncbi:hypothetical protein [Candidatus Harpocratesius sp.]